MNTFQKYAALAGLAILGSLATPVLGIAGNALVAGGIALAAQGIQEIDKPQSKVSAILAKKQKDTNSPIKQSRDRAKKGLPPRVDKRIAGR